jgi:hypothetical protein
MTNSINYAHLNNSVRTVPLELQNPNLFSSNKVGVQVNNYLYKNEVFMANPEFLENNDSLRPGRSGKFLTYSIDYTNSNTTQYNLKAVGNVPTLRKPSVDPRGRTIPGKFLFPAFTRLITGSPLGVKARKLFFGDNKQPKGNISGDSLVPKTNVTYRENPLLEQTEYQQTVERIQNMDSAETLGFFGTYPYFQVAPYVYNMSSTQFEHDVNARFFTDLLQRSFLQFSADGTPSNVTNIDVNQFLDNPVDFPYYAQHTPSHIAKNNNNTLHQSFMVFDYSKGTQKLETDDTIVSATLRLKVKSHFGERSVASYMFASQVTSLFGDLKCEPRTFEVARVKKEIANFNVSSDKTGVDKDTKVAISPTPNRFNPSDTFAKWDTPYGTGPKDIDTALTSEFTISEPLKEGEFIDIDITELLRDAVANRSQVLRLVVRPKAAYTDDGKINIGNDVYVSQGGYGQGNHWFEFFDETGDRPQVIVKAMLSPTASRSRINSFKKTRPGSSITK